MKGRRGITRAVTTWWLKWAAMKRKTMRVKFDMR
jgi:hypothetical protein